MVLDDRPLGVEAIRMELELSLPSLLYTRRTDICIQYEHSPRAEISQHLDLILSSLQSYRKK